MSWGEVARRVRGSMMLRLMMAVRADGVMRRDEVVSIKPVR